jgi:quercetin dioxygenase-like cupin family protein
MRSPKYLMSVVCCSGWLLGSPALAEPSGGQTVAPSPIERTLLLKQELEGMAGKELHVWLAEIKPSASTGKHKHPWQEFVYVLDGALAIEVQGRAAAQLKAGELFGVPSGQPHLARNLVDRTTRALVFGVAPKGEPLVVPLD